MKKRRFKNQKMCIKFTNGDRYNLMDYEDITFGQFWTTIHNFKNDTSTSFPNVSIVAISWNIKQ